jgi:nucleoside-diphosphate-sugar epimerase
MSSKYIADSDECFLVTGANGFIGTKVVDCLLEYGFTNIRCFVRHSSKLGNLQRTLDKHSAPSTVTLVVGDLLSREDCQKAVLDVSVIIHLAAGFDKSFAGAFMNSALTTRNLLDAFLQYGRPRRFVNVSSFAVYSNLGLKRGSILDETCPLENAPQERFDAYGFGKLQQEKMVKDYGRKHKLPYVIVRPGAVFGPGKRDLSGRVGINTFGFFIQVNGSQPLPLSFVDNCAEAIVLAGLTPGIDGEVFNIVDDEPLSGRQFLKAYNKKTGGFSVRIPYAIAYLFCLLWEEYAKRSKNQLPPAFNRRRCAAEWKSNYYSNRKAREQLDWKPRVPMQKAMEAFLSQFGSNGNDDAIKAEALERS